MLSLRDSNISRLLSAWDVLERVQNTPLAGLPSQNGNGCCSVWCKAFQHHIISCWFSYWSNQIITDTTIAMISWILFCRCILSDVKSNLGQSAWRWKPEPSNSRRWTIAFFRDFFDDCRVNNIDTKCAEFSIVSVAMFGPPSTVFLKTFGVQISVGFAGTYRTS